MTARATSKNKIDLLRFILVALLAMIVPAFCQQAAFAQRVAAGTTSQGTDVNGGGNFDIRQNYFKRYPFASAFWNADAREKYNNTNLDQAVAGRAHTYQAFAPVCKNCDAGYGIAYMQPPGMIANSTPAGRRDDELFNNTLTTFGLPMSDTQYQMISRENNQRMLELAGDPERMMWTATATAQQQASAASNSLAGVAEQSFGTAIDRIINADGTGTLINVANEGSVTGLSFSPGAADRAVGQAIYMVQRMYKQVFIPIAVLFLLPGAIITHAVGIVRRGFAIGGPETQNPFDGIMRAIVAVFLIPGTQVIVSWSIDAGNSMTYSVRDWVDARAIADWAHQLSFNTSLKDNAMLPPRPQPGASSGNANSSKAGGVAGSFFASLGPIGNLINQALGGLGLSITGEGLAVQQPETNTVQERQAFLSIMMQSGFNAMMFLASLTLTVLGAFQLVLMCYLFLLGPLAAAFYCWPQIGMASVMGSTSWFRGIFGSWVVGVIHLSLWRFLWMVVLAVMTQRLIYVGGSTGDLQWEVAMFTCFMGILLYAPSSFFDFSPNGAFGQASQLNEQFNKPKGGGGGGGSKGGSDSPGTSGNSDDKPQSLPNADPNQQQNQQQQNTASSSGPDEGGNDKGAGKNDALQGGDKAGSASPEAKDKDGGTGGKTDVGGLPPSAGGGGTSGGQGQGGNAGGIPGAGPGGITQGMAAGAQGTAGAGVGAGQGNGGNGSKMASGMPPISLNGTGGGGDEGGGGGGGSKVKTNPNASQAQVNNGQNDAQKVVASVPQSGGGGNKGGGGEGGGQSISAQASAQINTQAGNANQGDLPPSADNKGGK